MKQSNLSVQGTGLEVSVGHVVLKCTKSPPHPTSKKLKGDPKVSDRHSLSILVDQCLLIYFKVNNYATKSHVTELKEATLSV